MKETLTALLISTVNLAAAVDHMNLQYASVVLKNQLKLEAELGVYQRAIDQMMAEKPGDVEIGYLLTLVGNIKTQNDQVIEKLRHAAGASATIISKWVPNGRTSERRSPRRSVHEAES